MIHPLSSDHQWNDGCRQCERRVLRRASWLSLGGTGDVRGVMRACNSLGIPECETRITWETLHWNRIHRTCWVNIRVRMVMIRNQTWLIFFSSSFIYAIYLTAGFSLVVVSTGYCLVAMRGLLIMVASPGEGRLKGAQASVVVAPGL